MSDSNPWYHKGLSFKCTGCGKCCTGSPGYVWITEEEVSTISAHLGLSEKDFVRKYVRNVGGRLALLERRKNAETYDCIFLKDKKCEIYAIRPKQCQTFPWWRENLSSPEAWAETGEYCEGVNHSEAPLITLAEIKKDLHSL